MKVYIVVLLLAMIFSRAASFFPGTLRRGGSVLRVRSLSTGSGSTASPSSGRATPSPSLSMSAEADLKALTEEYMNLGVEGKAQVGWQKLFSPEAIFIRPTGNPMGMKMYESMLKSDDVKVTSNELLSIDKIDVCSAGAMGYIIFTAHSKFTYQGTPNDDIAVFTMIAKKGGNGWRFVGGSRSTGRSPGDPKPDFSVE